MKSTYMKQVEGSVRPAIADLTRLDRDPDLWGPNTWMLNRINVPHEARGRGHATNLLAMVLYDADAEGATVVLGPSPSDGLDFTALVAWYERHGFKWTRSGAMMERTPQ